MKMLKKYTKMDESSRGKKHEVEKKKKAKLQGMPTLRNKQRRETWQRRPQKTGTLGI